MAVMPTKRAALGIALLPWAFCVCADVRLPQIIDDHMVLQQNAPVPIWGWASPGEKIRVRFDDNPAETTQAGTDGRWRVTLPALAADHDSHRISIVGNNSIKIDDVLVGEVWLGSGQSNMQWPLAASAGSTAALATANHPQIRLFRVPQSKSDLPASDFEADWLEDEDWEVCTRRTARRFSAILYYFALHLHATLDLPIGVIDSSWSGSPIEQWTPGSGLMYNAMVAPLQPLSLRGVLWYQGESNVRRRDGFAYFQKMKTLIEGWRDAWGIQFPFYFVQIAPWSGSPYGPGELPALWEAQSAALKIPGTGMVVTTDLVDDIDVEHPGNKREVGRRLALWALAKTYGRDELVFSGPLYRSMTIEGERIRIFFAHTAGSLMSRDGMPLNGFEIAADDGQFYPAQAVVEGSTVVVHAEGVAHPAQVRFGWHNTATPNLVNGAGLPASAFRSTDWKGGTSE